MRNVKQIAKLLNCQRTVFDENELYRNNQAQIWTKFFNFPDIA